MLNVQFPASAVVCAIPNEKPKGHHKQGRLAPQTPQHGSCQRQNKYLMRAAVARISTTPSNSQMAAMPHASHAIITCVTLR